MPPSDQAQGPDMKPQSVPAAQSRHRRIATALPAPDSVPVFEELRQHEASCAPLLPLVCPAKAEGTGVEDPWGNRWIDFANTAPFSQVGQAEEDRVAKSLGALGRRQVARLLLEHSPEGLNRFSLFQSSAEAVESAIQLALRHGKRVGSKRKVHFVTFGSGLQWRGLGGGLASGRLSLQLPDAPRKPLFVQAPFPDGWLNTDESLDGLLSALSEADVSGHDVNGILIPAVSDRLGAMPPAGLMKKLAAWCQEHRALLIVDESSIGLARTGRLFALERLGAVPDVLCCSDAGLSGSSFSALLCKDGAVDSSEPDGAMQCAPALVDWSVALARLDFILRADITGHAEKLGGWMQAELQRVAGDYPRLVGRCTGQGLLASVMVCLPGVQEPDPELAAAIMQRCFRKGLLLPPVVLPATLRIQPPVTTTKDAVREGLEVLREVLDELNR